jgi:ABC-type sugar transport system ATPase subunit
MKEELIVIENGIIEKRGHPIFKGLYLHIYKKEILGIIFDSVIERKCLLDFFKGNYSLNSGRFYIEGQKINLGDNDKYCKNNITVIEKSSKLISTLNIEENIFIFADKKNTVNNKKYKEDIHIIIQQFNIDVNISKAVIKLTPKERVIVELIKAYVEGKKIIVLTHITGFLKKNELEEIYLLLMQLQNSGMTFVVVESFEDIVFEWTNQLVIIQSGKTVGIFEPKSINRHLIYSVLMKDQKQKNMDNINKIELSEKNDKIPVLEFNAICTNIISDLNITVEAGEILKIYYMDDESCEHIVELLKGLRRPLSGEISLAGQDYKVDDVYQAVGKGICFIEESPYENMLFYNMNVRDNLSLALSGKITMFWFRKRYIKSVDQFIKSFWGQDIAEIKLRKLEPRILQQIAYYKWYLYAPKVVVCIKPFTEADIHLQEMTIEMISLLKARGISIIILTPNFSELYRVDGEILYIKKGQVIDEDEVYQTLYKK